MFMSVAESPHELFFFLKPSLFLQVLIHGPPQYLNILNIFYNMFLFNSLYSAQNSCS